MTSGCVHVILYIRTSETCVKLDVPILFVESRLQLLFMTLRICYEPVDYVSLMFNMKQSLVLSENSTQDIVEAKVPHFFDENSSKIVKLSIVV